MNQDKEDNGFKLEIEPEDPVSVYKDEIEELRLEKLSQRVTLISILIPLMIVVILAVAYLDIKKRVIRTQYSGTSSVQSLAKELDSRFSSLSLRQAELESKMEAITKSNASHTVAVDKIASRLDKLSRSAASTKVLSKLESRTDRRLKTITSSLKKLEGQIDTYRAGTKGELEDLKGQTAALAERVGLAEKQIQQIAARLVTKEDMELAVRLETLKIRQALELDIDKLAKRLEKLRKDLARLRSKLDRRSGSTPTRPTGAAKAKQTKTKPPSQAGENVKPPQKIIEQDIKQ